MSDEMVQMQRVRRTKGFESISRDALQIKSLSFKARGIMAYLESMPDDWEVHGAKGIADASDKDGYYAVNEGLKELEAAGLLARLKRQGARARWEWLWIYSDDPADVALAAEEWAAAGAVSSRGGNPRPRLQGELITPKAPTSDDSVMGNFVHGQAEHGEPQNKEVDLEVDSRGKSFTRDKSLVSNTRARDEDQPAAVKARSKPSQDEKLGDSSEGLWGDDQSLFGGDQLPAEPPTVTAQTVTAAWVDANRANGYSPAKSRIAQVSRMAKELLAAGNDPDRVLAAARSAGSKGWYTIDTELATSHRNGHRKPQLGTIDRRIAEFEAMKNNPDPEILARAGIPYPHPERLSLTPGETP